MSEIVRAEIASSWQRARRAGLRPADSATLFSVSEVDRRSRLLAAATPVLDRMENMLAGTGFCVLLADRDARLVDMRFGSHQVHDVVAEVGVQIGRSFTEETSGTNSIATVHALRSPIAVRGGEHYIDELKRFSCYGHPLHHPVSHRIEGILDITFLQSDDNPLLAPLLAQAAHDITERLLEQTRTGEHLLLRHFQRAGARRRGAPVVAIADEIVLENASAGQLVGPADHTALRALTDGAMNRRGHVPRVMLSSGYAASLRWERPEGGGFVIEIDLLDDGTAVLNALDRATRDAIVSELDRHEGNKRGTAEALGMSRTTLYKRMRELGIDG
ncbi:hypothetical protein ASG12_18035 [Williamsia sp. Leaf354]|jgi:transcriptional regulator of acetoin/glycerol metabolism|uniref:helix-turn-helix domain-containing protein n=1 Tax=Williamsia sp. Leaf354 TaxID=1736349 RepID=UPI0006F297DD|nr:helix-turn-helix domain-containing protein [Williamsia sp. Leaf354]KQR96119.1 hypothetical protein ASG12_18035 [Williamsia sp. Leaf354]